MKRLVHVLPPEIKALSDALPNLQIRGRTRNEWLNGVPRTQLALLFVAPLAPISFLSYFPMSINYIVMMYPTPRNSSYISRYPFCARVHVNM